MKHRAGSSTVPRKTRRVRRLMKRAALVSALSLMCIILYWYGRSTTGADENTAAGGAREAYPFPALEQTSKLLPTIASTATGTDLASHSVVTPTDTVSRENTGPFKEIDDLDMATPRAWETFVPFEKYLTCLAGRLFLDMANKRELPFPVEGNATRATVIPFLIQPVSIELSDTKQFMCALQVPLRHVTYVMNGDAPEMRLFLETLRDITAGWTDRVQIYMYPENIGSAGAINVGLRHAVSAFDYDTVPFLFVSEPSVHIPAPTMADLVPSIYDFITYDKAKIAKLEAEVAAEAKANEERQQPLLLRTGPEGVPIADGQGLLSTSALLPQRIRNLSIEAQMEAFAEHYAFFYFNTDEGPGRHSSFFVTRLALLVGGYLDENYYPDFFDDPDIRWRYRQLGFASFRASFDKPAVQFYDDPFLMFGIDERDAEQAEEEKEKGEGGGNAVLGVARSKKTPKKRRKRSQQAEKFRWQIRESFGEGFSFSYAAWKWHVRNPVTFQAEFGPHPIYHKVNRERPAGSLLVPVDAWVLDRRRQRAIRRKLAQLPLENRQELLFDTTLLEKTDFRTRE